MRTLWLGLCLSCFVATGRADTPRPFEADLSLGVGAFVGRGWNANQLGGSLLASAGFRFHPYLSIAGTFVLQEFYLRTEQDPGPHGKSWALSLAPHVYPLGRRFAVEPYLVPMAGYALTSGHVTAPGAELRFASRGLVLGGSVGALYTLRGAYGLGLSAMVLRLFVDESCIHVRERETSCEALRDDVTRLLSGQVTFRLSFPIREAHAASLRARRR